MIASPADRERSSLGVKRIESILEPHLSTLSREVPPYRDLVLAFGMMKEDPRRTAFSIGVAVLFAVVALGVALFVSSFATAPIRAADREHSAKKLPAGPTHTKELVGK